MEFVNLVILAHSFPLGVSSIFTSKVVGVNLMAEVLIFQTTSHIKLRLLEVGPPDLKSTSSGPICSWLISSLVTPNPVSLNP